MKASGIITWAMLRGMVMKGNSALRRIDEHSRDAMASNEKLLMELLRDNSNTEYGKKYGFADIHSVREFQEKVPFTTFDDYAPYIDRMVKNGEKDLITAYPVIQYAETSGSIGVQKRIPLTDRAMKVYQDYSGIRMFALADRYYKEKYHRSIPVGRGLNAMEVESGTMEDGTPKGSVSGSAIKKFKNVMPYFLTSPIPVIFPTGGMNMQYMRVRFALEDRDMSYMVSSFMTNISDMMNFMKNNWEMIVDDIENGTVNPDMVKGDEYLKPILPYLKKRPERAAELRKVFEDGFDTPIVPRLWPKLSYVCAIGTGGFAVYTEKVKQFIGDIPIDYSVYAASEGIFASASAMNDPKYDLLTDSCFFEFLPTDGSGDEAHPLTLDKLEVGKEYEIIITNLSGFYRYRIKDVVRVLGYHNTTPQITFAYRISQMVNLAAEKTTEEHLSHAVTEFSKAIGCQIDDYCLYIDYDVDPARYVLLVEPDQPLPVDRLGEYARVFEEKLRHANVEYSVCRDDRSIGHPMVLLQQQETHALWREFKIYKGASPNQVKPVRIIDAPNKEKFFFGMLEEGSGRELLSEKVQTD
ncbi:MAG: GH3 auxin-responsive promoter family protein [Oscillospiraceae bacterium]|nr:GH3 auxin-responsive promoter family protein [Oscillospiraceae bacterium]